MEPSQPKDSVKHSSPVLKRKSMSKTDKLKEYIISYSLNNCPEGNQGYNRILLQLCGYLGHGKSSLINSCVHVLQDRKQQFTVVAQSGEAQGGLTMERKSYPLTPTITIVDNRGCSTLNGFETGELYAQLGNFIPLDLKVEWTQGFEEMLTRLEGSELEPNFRDIIVPIFVYSVKRDVAPSEVQEMKNFLTNCRNLTGIFPLIVLTHKTRGNLTKLHDLFEGMGAEEIISVENYTAEDHTETRGRHFQFLNLIYKALEDVDFKMQKPINKRKELAKHKTFLFSFLHTNTPSPPFSEDCDDTPNIQGGYTVYEDSFSGHTSTHYHHYEYPQRNYPFQ